MLFDPACVAASSIPRLTALSSAQILNELMDVFFAKLPQSFSLCRTKLYREQPRLSATGSVVSDPSLADSQPFRYTTDVEQTLGFRGKGERFDEFKGRRSGWFQWSW